MIRITSRHQAVLQHTHYGLKIYAYILKQYYPDEINICLSGREAKVTRNPFKSGTKTLRLKQNDHYCFEHTDDEFEEFKGNAFDFAMLHFKCNETLLIDLICKELNLKVSESKQELSEKDPPLCLPVFSFFRRPISNIVPCRECTVLNIYDFIKSNYAFASTCKLRSIQDRKEKKLFKSMSFDYVTFSGLFSTRADKNLLRHSGLICIDFDNLQEKESLKDKLLQDQNFETELLFTSPSGDGLKWVISIDITKHTHQDYFRGIEKYVRQKYGQQVDKSGKDVSRACFLPHDQQVFINTKHKQNDSQQI